MMRVGQNAMYFEDYMLSIQYFNRVIEAKPYLAKPYLFRAIAKLNLEDFNGAETDASKALELNPFLSDAYEVRGVARQNMGNASGAIKDYDGALEQMPGNKNIMFNKALAQEDIKDYDGAIATYDAIINSYPGYDNGYIGRAKLKLALGDTISAVDDLNHSLELNPDATNAYVMRADINIKSGNNFQKALEDMNHAIKLQPKFSGFFVNRAFLRYKLKDYFGAMADYDYAIVLDPANITAYFNRGLLRTEVSDNDRAIEDFSKVLAIDPNDSRALFNRAFVYNERKNYREALADINKVIDAFPETTEPLSLRMNIYMNMGNKSKAAADYDKIMAINKKNIAYYDKNKDNISQKPEDFESKSNTSENEIFANRFTALITMENQLEDTQEFNNKNIRGKVQDRNPLIEIAPSFIVSYYASPTELSPTTYYMDEATRINESGVLPMILMVTDNTPPLDDKNLIQRHFNSIEEYSITLNSENPRPIDYFGRAMEKFTLHDYDGAAEDFTKAIELAPDFALAYFMRGACHQRLAGNIAKISLSQSDQSSMNMQSHLFAAIDDFNSTSELSPRSAFPHFNKGNILVDLQDYTSAIAAYSEAIDLKPDFGEAYFNRGYVYFKLGNREAGVADLSRAGELGILPSYSLIKRMGN